MSRDFSVAFVQFSSVHDNPLVVESPNYRPHAFIRVSPEFDWALTLTSQITPRNAGRQIGTDPCALIHTDRALKCPCVLKYQSFQSYPRKQPSPAPVAKITFESRKALVDVIIADMVKTSISGNIMLCNRIPRYDPTSNSRKFDRRLVIVLTDQLSGISVMPLYSLKPFPGAIQLQSSAAVPRNGCLVLAQPSPCPALDGWWVDTRQVYSFIPAAMYVPEGEGVAAYVLAHPNDRVKLSDGSVDYLLQRIQEMLVSKLLPLGAEGAQHDDAHDRGQGLDGGGVEEDWITVDWEMPVAVARPEHAHAAEDYEAEEQEGEEEDEGPDDKEEGVAEDFGDNDCELATWFDLNEAAEQQHKEEMMALAGMSLNTDGPLLTC